MVKINYSIIIFILFLYYIHSEKIIQINSFNSVYCNKEQSKSNPQFSFSLNATFINITSMKYFYLPLKGPNNQKALCSPHPSSSDISCNMNVKIYPIIDEKVIIETSFDKINDIKIIWNLESSEIFEGTCTYAYNYKFTVNSYEENTICKDEYNVFIMNGTTEENKKIMNNDPSPVYQISFIIEIDDESGSAICYWHSWEDFMECKVKTEKAKAKGKFYRTIFEIPNYYTSVLIDQSFEINFKDCRPEIYFNITSSSAICNQYYLEIYLFTNYVNYKGISYINFPLINPKNQYLSCRTDYLDTEIKCEINVRRYPIINDKYTFDTSFTRIEDDKINILWNLDNPTVFEGTCTLKYSQKFTVTKYGEDIKCNNGYNYFIFYGTYENYNLKSNKFLSFLSETTKVQFLIYLNNELENINCYIYDTEGRMECWLNGQGNIAFFTTTGSIIADNSLILINLSYQTELKNCSTEEKIMEITKISNPQCNLYSYTKDYSLSFYLLINIQNIDYEAVNDFKLPLKIKNHIFKAICSLLYKDNMLCKLNITAFPIIKEEIYLDTSIRMINNDIKLIWNLGSLLVYNGTCFSRL